MRYGLLAATTYCFSLVGLAAGQTPGAAQPDSARVNVTTDAASIPAAPTHNDQFGWTRFEYLWWQFKNGPVPVPLATQGGAFPTGLLGTPGGTVVLGGGDVEFDNASGARLSGGLWLNAERTLAWDASGFLFNKATFNAGVVSNAAGSPTLSRLFFDTTTGALAGFAISSPGVFAGNVQLEMYSRLWGADSNVRATLSDSNGLRFDGLVGVRYLGLDERLAIEQQLTTLPATGAPVLIPDRFYNTNQFLGGQVGGEAEYQFDRWFVAALGKVALGVNCTQTEVSSGGLLVQPTNRGEYEDTALAYAAEVQFRVGCNLCNCARVFVAYNCLYWSNVGRPGDQIDPAINSARLFGGNSGPARPAFSFHDTDFWAHGASVGVELRY